WGRRKTQPAVVGPARGRLVATTFPPESGVKQLAVFHLCAGIPEPLGDGRVVSCAAYSRSCGYLNDTGPSSSRWRVAGSEARPCRWPTAVSRGAQVARHHVQKAAPPTREKSRNSSTVPAGDWMRGPGGYFGGARASPQSPGQLLTARFCSGNLLELRPFRCVRCKHHHPPPS
ncbi:hypothetical protein ACJJTC_015803, partial [Scirpophaga incertulas]